MIQKTEPLSPKSFDKGLITRSDILKPEFDWSPNCMNIKWYFDGSVGKRFGSSTTNTVRLGSTAIAGWTIDSGGTLSTNLVAYWKLNETSLVRNDEVGELNFQVFDDPSTETGISGLAPIFTAAGSEGLYISNNSSLQFGTGNGTISVWVKPSSITGTRSIVSKVMDVGGGSFSGFEYQLLLAGAVPEFQVSANGSSLTTFVDGASLSIGTWYNIIAQHSNNSHIGITVDNGTITTAGHTAGLFVGTAPVTLGYQSGLTVGVRHIDATIDEMGMWNKFVTSAERSDLYGGGTANTYTGVGQSGFAWAAFDFGATSLRWFTVAAGTGIQASSNGATTFVVIATSRTQNYQYFERSRSLLIATADSYDVPLYWAGSVGTFMATLAPNSAPSCKYSVNYNGFLILLNSQTRPRGFFYADENLQLTSAWADGFDIPSSFDDEITGSFILSKFLYVSTRYKMYRVAFVGGNPDWSYLKVKDFGYVPRTVKILTLKGGQVAIGLDWSRRWRVFDGYDDLIISDNVENDNGMCDFAMSKISLAGSGLTITNAEYDPNEQEYHMNVAIGGASSQTTHALILNARTMAMYPYSGQEFNCMAIMESSNKTFLMACDRSGFVHILNSGNRDVAIAINEIYDSPFLFSKIPETVSKSRQLNFYFVRDSSGTLYSQDRADLSNVFSEIRQLRDSVGNSELKSTESSVQLVRTFDVPSVQNTFQFRITSSSGTANPWRMTRWDYFGKGLGVGKGVTG